jgi:glyoxylase I family protein
MLNVRSVHHVAIICSDYERSKDFYTRILGLDILAENFRADRNSWKLDLMINGNYVVELFSFPSPPPRISRPEACGLRHLAFAVDDIAKAIKSLNDNSVKTEPVRIDEFTGRKFTFFNDPDDLPLELYEYRA